MNDRFTSNILITENENLVYSIARSYQMKGIPIEDITQEGFMGLLEAHQHFDPSKQAKFSTYAVYWIKKYILLAFEKENDHGKKIKDSYSDLNEQKKHKYSLQVSDQGFSKLLKLPPDMPVLEESVIRLSYEKKMPIKEIALHLDLTNEKVRQIREKALRRIKCKQSSCFL